MTKRKTVEQVLKFMEEKAEWYLGEFHCPEMEGQLGIVRELVAAQDFRIAELGKQLEDAKNLEEKHWQLAQRHREQRVFAEAERDVLRVRHSDLESERDRWKECSVTLEEVNSQKNQMIRALRSRIESAPKVWASMSSLDSVRLGFQRSCRVHSERNDDEMVTTMQVNDMIQFHVVPVEEKE